MEELNKLQILAGKINKNLKHDKGKILFPQKLDPANKIIDNVKLTKITTLK